MKRNSEMQPNGGPPPSTPQELREFVRRFEPFSFLRAIAEVSRHEGESDRIGRLFPRICNSWGLADLARYVVQYGSRFRSREATIADVLQGMNLVNGIFERLHSADDVFLFLYRTAVKQFPDQQEPQQRIGRMLKLFEDLPQEHDIGSFDIRARFRDALGMTVPEFTWVTFALWSRTLRGEELDPAMIYGHDIPVLRDTITRDSVLATIRELATTQVELRERSELELRDLEDDPLALYAFNPLTASPLVRVPGDDERYIAPVPKLLLRRMVDGPYYMLLERYGTQFTEAFGHLFQEYVGWVLRPMVGDRLRPEFSYRWNKTTARSPDWFIDEGIVSRIECKTGRLTKRAKSVATRAERRDAFVRIYGQASQQLTRFDAAASKIPEAAWLAGRPSEDFIVLLDDIYLANSPVWQEERAAARDVYDLGDREPNVLGVHSLEIAGPQLRTGSLAAQAREKRADPERRTWDWEQYFGRGGEPNHALIERWLEFTKDLEE